VDAKAQGAGAVVAEVESLGAAARLRETSVRRLLDRREERLEQGVPRLATGLPRLDAALSGGLIRPSLVVLGAGPKAGKSTLTQKIAVHHVEAGGVAYVLDLENGPDRFLRRVLCPRSRLGPSQVAAAFANRAALQSRAEVERWNEAKAWLRSQLGDRLHVEFQPPGDLEAKLEQFRRLAAGRPLLVAIDSLQKLPMADMTNRRAGVDEWLRFFERLRHELEAVILVVSEIKRGREGYRVAEDAFKESGGIEYSADLAMTLDRPSAEEDEEAVSTLRIELDRDCEEDSRGAVASYAVQRPFYELEERDPVERKAGRRSGPRAEKADAARAFLEGRLAAGPVQVEQLVQEGAAEGISRSVLYRAKADLALATATVNLRNAWRLP
jgi:replicative DNA helicase